MSRGHVDCTANLNSFKPLSEKLVAKNLLVKHATTDGDATSV